MVNEPSVFEPLRFYCIIEAKVSTFQCKMFLESDALQLDMSELQFQASMFSLVAPVSVFMFPKNIAFDISCKLSS